MLRGNPPPPNIPIFSFSFYLFSFTFQKKSENFGGGGLSPLNPPLNTPLLDVLEYLVYGNVKVLVLVLVLDQKVLGT